MASIASRSREILARAHSADRMSALARARMLERVLHMASSDVPTLAGIDAAPVMLPKLSIWMKCLSVLSSKSAWAGLFLLSAGATLALWELRPASAPSAPLHGTPAATLPKAATIADETAPTPASEPEPASSKAAETTTRRSATMSRARPHLPRRTASAQPAPVTNPSATTLPVSQPSSPPPTAATTIDAEYELLQRAHAELSAGRAEQARALLERHRASFPNGQLAQTREVALMLALCQLGRPQQAHALAQRFVLEHPRSPFVGRMRQECKLAQP